MKSSLLKTLLLLLGWLILGVALRFTNLAAKSPWTDEFCTLVFSLGNSFHPVPLNRAIPLDVLLQPLHPNLNAGATDVLHHLLSESNHPPVYFLLTHWWLQLWPPDANNLASVWAARSLSALFGAASIPAIYGLAWLAFRSHTVSHLAAAMMAVSPFGIFLAQEARHYTLAILWAIASLCCLVVAVRHIQQRAPIPIWIIFIWIAINFLGISTHYFFSLTLGAEALGLIVLAWHYKRQTQRNRERENLLATRYSPWLQVLIAAVGTLIGGLFWLPIFLASNRGGELTAWIQGGDTNFVAWISPVFQALAAWITMISLLPVEASALPVVIASGLVMLLFFIWAIPLLRRGIEIQLQQPATRSITQVLAGFVLGAIALFFILTYAFGIDLTRGARYNFVYFPAVMVLVGASLAAIWQSANRRERRSERKKDRRKLFSQVSVAIVWLMGFLSAITVVCNLGYQKYYRPDLLVQLVQNSHVPILIATTQKTHVQIGEMMGIAREFKIARSATTPLFFLAHQDQYHNISTAALQRTLNQLPKPLDLWLVNFEASVNFNACVANSLSAPLVDGYNYRLFHCYPTQKD